MHGFVDEYLEPFFRAIHDNLAVRLAVSREAGVHVDCRENCVVGGSLLFKRRHIKIHIETFLRAIFICETCNERKPHKHLICVNLVDRDFGRTYTIGRG